MRLNLSRFAFLLLVAVAAAPLFAGSIGADITLPVAGYLELPDDLVYRTELTVTNHRDVLQYVRIELISDGHAGIFRVFPLEPRQTTFLADGGMGTGNRATRVGAFRVSAATGTGAGRDFETTFDPLGQLEVSAFVVAERGRFASRGSTRQEVAGIPSSEYFLEEMTFVGVRHDLPSYTNVGITNLHPTQTETFFVQYQHLDPVAVVVPPLSARQIRIPGEGNSGRWVKVYPEWSIGDGAPVRTTPWVAYASTVDGYTGDAYSGTRVPAGTRIRNQ